VENLIARARVSKTLRAVTKVQNPFLKDFVGTVVISTSTIGDRKRIF
jgi:hypothetical protein